MPFQLDDYKGKRVFITGHSGFKGTWLSRVLLQAGADVTGYALCRERTPDFCELSGVRREIREIRGDVRDLESLRRALNETKPEIVIHLAAQPIVLTGYQEPVETYSTNIMGTVHLLECVRRLDTVRAFLNVTTDKVYQNDEKGVPFVESDPLDGPDPYANSKSCSELVTHCYKRSFFDASVCAISTARSGNVIGGGDFSPNRIVPDCVRAAVSRQTICVRNPASIRPYQHVLEPLVAYLTIAAHPEKQGSYNVGPDANDCARTDELVNLFISAWGEDLRCTVDRKEEGRESTFLRLDNAKLKNAFAWKPTWELKRAMEKTVEWYKVWRDGGDVPECMDCQIASFLESSQSS